MALKFDEEEVFTILSHPVRRRILKTIFEYSRISFSEIKEWGHSTGSIYHHLRTMQRFVSQDEQKQYVLTEDGHELCRWFLDSDEGTAKVEQIEAFTSLSARIVAEVDRRSRLSTLVSLIVASLAIFLSSRAGIIIVGPFMFNAPGGERGGVVIIQNALFFILCIIVYIVLGALIKGDPLQVFEGMRPHVFAVFSIALLPVFIEAVFIPLLGIAIAESVWVMLSVLNQVIFLLLLSSLSVYTFSSDIRGSILISLGVSYLMLGLAIILNVAS